MCINGETFEYYKIQKRVESIKNSVNILLSHGYTVVDLEGKIIHNKIK
jgi:CRISPR/Cas system-associated endonuclease Cas1